MKLRFVRIAVVATLLAGLGACQVPGVVTYRWQNGRWEPYEASFHRQDITPAEVATLQNRLNGN